MRHDPSASRRTAHRSRPVPGRSTMRPSAPVLRATVGDSGPSALRAPPADGAPRAGVLRRVGRQVAAGIGTAVIAMLAAALITPVYLRGLGAEAYGVLAF